MVKPILNNDGEIMEYIAIRKDMTKIIKLNQEVKKLHNYDIEQQNIAKEKIEIGIRNDFKENSSNVIFTPLDILSGDFYSLYKRKDGSKFIYIIDGQGHGISPALTIFSISSIINNNIDTVPNLQTLIDTIFPIIKTFLGEIEQLSYTMIMVSADNKTLSYSSGGMYPFLVKTNQEVIKLKANNIPFMDFSSTPIVTEIAIKDWESLLLYSDGFVEHENNTLEKYTPLDLIQNSSLINKIKKIVKKTTLEDDVTVVYLENEKI